MRIIRSIVGAIWLVSALSLMSCTTTSTTQQSEPSFGDGGGAGAAPDSDNRRRARTRLELAVSYYSKGQSQIALDELRRATQADPSYHEPYNMLGLIYMDINERPQAEENFQQALRLAPNDSESNNNYGWFLCQTDRAKESLAYFAKALKNPLYQTPAIALRNSGICAMRAGDQKAATDYLTRAFQVDPSSPVTSYYLADVLFRNGDYERSRFYIQRLNKQSEPTAASMWLEIKVLHKLGERNPENALASQLRRSFPRSAEYVLYQRGAYDE